MQVESSTAKSFYFYPAPILDTIVQSAARVASKFLPVVDAGAFRYSKAAPSFWESWRYEDSITIRLGRLEFQIDVRARAAIEEE